MVAMRNLLLVFVAMLQLAASDSTRLEARLHFFEYCTYYSYPVEDHVIPTNDGYKLQFYRIQAKNTVIVSGKVPVYLQHGLADSSDTWIVNEQRLAPGFYLANLGYDVWIGNTRGNRYSSMKLNYKVKHFWNFTFDEMAEYDLPSALKYIVSVTHQRVHYVGHSQGTLIMFIALSQRYPEVEENLASFCALGPVAYITNMESGFLKMLVKLKLYEGLADVGAKYVFLLGRNGQQEYSRSCGAAPSICAEGLKAVSEKNNTVNNLQRLPVIMGHFPSGSSVKNMGHFEQYLKKAQFKRFDYGAKGNQLHYGQPIPPFYNLSQIKFPVHLFVGKYDKLADLKDSQRLFAELTNSKNKTMRIYDYGHATFIWGKSLKHMEDVVAVIQKASMSLQY